MTLVPYKIILLLLSSTGYRKNQFSAKFYVIETHEHTDSCELSLDVRLRRRLKDAVR